MLKRAGRAGCCFYFTLPAVAAPPKKAGHATESGGTSRSAVKILVIEDDLAAPDRLKSQLASAGYEVAVCTRPRQAVKVAAELQPDALTTDIVMLPVNGWDILSSLKGDLRTAKIPVVVVTVIDQRATGALLGAEE